MMYGIPVAFAVALVHGAPADALSNQPISPIVSDMVRVSSGNGDDRIKHVIKHEDSSTIERIDLVAYYNKSAVSQNQTITIFGRDSGNQYPLGERCHALGDDTDKVVQVTISLFNEDTTAPANQREVKYSIRKDRACNGGSATNTRNNKDNARMFGTYQVPLGFQQQYMKPDSMGSQLYKLKISIGYPRNAAGTALAVQKGQTGEGPSKKQQIAFRVRLSNWNTTCQPGTAATSACTRYLGVMPLTNLDNTNRNFSTLGPYLDGKNNNSLYTRQYFKFGLPCTETEKKELKIVVYDIDNGNENWNNMYIRVQRSTNSNWLSSTTTNLSTSTGGEQRLQVTGDYTTSNGGTRIHPGDGSGKKVEITFTLQPSVNYRIEARSVHVRNLFGVGLPAWTIFGDMDCAYNLTPSVSVSTTALSPGGSVSGINGNIFNNGVTSNTATNAVVRYVIPRAVVGNPRSTGTTTTANNPGFGCQIANYVRAGNTNCRQLGNTPARTYPSKVNTPSFSTPFTDTLADTNLVPGDRVCYMKVVNRHNQTAAATSWRFSNSYCILVAKLPFAQVWGNDLRVGGRYPGDMAVTGNAMIRTSLMRMGGASGRYYGSWTEYGVLAPGQITNMSSGSGLATGSTSNNQAQWSGLTFARGALDPQCAATTFGCFTDGPGMGTLPDVNDGVDRGAFVGVPRTDGTTLISATPNYTGSRIWRNTGGNIEITDNITARPGPYSNERDIPQRIIIANNINIRSNVTRIDAWLIATGTINTCSNVAGNPTITTCNQPLTINGPTIARSLLMRRTAGADSAASATTPAERFNLRSDTYIWAYNQAKRSGTYHTTYIRELAPRY